jgi:hypothetical protein
MRSDPGWEAEQKLIADAKVLAEFANLTPDGVQSFHNAHPDFFPASWWDYKPTHPIDDEEFFQAMQFPDMQWEIVQRLIRGAWRRHFQMSASGFVLLLGIVFDPERLGWDKAEERLPIAMGLNMMAVSDFPYHDVVRWLVGQSWRVKQCKYEQCGKCFIAEASQRKFCSNAGDTSCFWAHRKTDRKNVADEVNRNRRNKYDPKQRRRQYLRSKRRKA